VGILLFSIPNVSCANSVTRVGYVTDGDTPRCCICDLHSAAAICQVSVLSAVSATIARPYTPTAPLRASRLPNRLRCSLGDPHSVRVALVALLVPRTVQLRPLRATCGAASASARHRG
jgi:hypothetical protein